MRVVVCGQQCFGCSIRKEGEIDWRSKPLVDEQLNPVELPSSVSRKCVEIVQSLGLHFGVLDLIATEEGFTYFLEGNPHGGWLWMEELHNLPISEAIVSMLAQ